MTGRNVTASTLQLLRLKEGAAGGKPALKAYKDTKGIWTIGYGATWYKDYKTQRVKQGDVMTFKDAENLLEYHANYFAKAGVNRYIKVPLTQNQFDACLSLCFNMGESNFRDSRVVAQINANPKNYTAVANSFLSYENTDRRKEEANLYAKVDAIVKTGSAILGIFIAFVLFKIFI